ncbi:MAG TPA: hypothetical protein VGM37_04825 [Armatimonadota bacterium]
MRSNRDNLDLAAFRKRIRMLRAWRLGAIGACIGAGAAAILAGLDLARLVYTRPAALVALAALGAVCGVFRALFEQIGEDRVARSVDGRAGLDDRLTSAAEVPEESGGMAPALHADARRHAADLSARQLYPVRLSRWHGAAFTLCAVAAILYALGNAGLFQSPQRRSEAAELKQAAVEVQRVLKPAEQAAKQPGATAEDKALARQLNRFAQDLKRARMTKQEALVRANDLADKARRLEKERGVSLAKSVQGAQTAADALRKMDASGRLEKSDDAKLAEQAAAAQKDIADLQRQIAAEQKGGKNAGKMAGLQSRLTAAQSRLNSIRLSQRAQEFLRRLAANKDYQEAQRLLAALAAQAASQASTGQGQLTQEQLEAAARRLEEMAKQFGDEAQLRELARQMLEAARHARQCKIGGT